MRCPPHLIASDSLATCTQASRIIKVYATLCLCYAMLCYVNANQMHPYRIKPYAMPFYVYAMLCKWNSDAPLSRSTPFRLHQMHPYRERYPPHLHASRQDYNPCYAMSMLCYVNEIQMRPYRMKPYAMPYYVYAMLCYVMLCKWNSDAPLLHVTPSHVHQRHPYRITCSLHLNLVRLMASTLGLRKWQMYPDFRPLVFENDEYIVIVTPWPSKLIPRCLHLMHPLSQFLFFSLSQHAQIDQRNTSTGKVRWKLPLPPGAVTWSSISTFTWNNCLRCFQIRQIANKASIANIEPIRRWTSSISDGTLMKTYPVRLEIIYNKCMSKVYIYIYIYM